MDVYGQLRKNLEMHACAYVRSRMRGPLGMEVENDSCSDWNRLGRDDRD